MFIGVATAFRPHHRWYTSLCPTLPLSHGENIPAVAVLRPQWDQGTVRRQ